MKDPSVGGEGEGPEGGPPRGSSSETDPRDVLEVVHHHPGRLRVRAAALRGTLPSTPALERALQATPGVLRHRHSPRTGSLLIEYEPGLADPDHLLAQVAAATGLVSPLDPRAPVPYPAQPALATIDATRELNAIVYELTGFRADLRSLAPAALAGAALISWATSKHERMPRWDNLLYWSYSVFTALHQREIVQRGGAGGEGVPLEEVGVPR